MRFVSCSKLILSLILLVLATSGCQPPLIDNTPVITDSRINEEVTSESINVVLLDGQSNALREGLDTEIKQRLTALTGRPTELIICAVTGSYLEAHLLTGKIYMPCAQKRLALLQDPRYRVIGTILIQGESNAILDSPNKSWPDLFKQYKEEVRADFIYDTMPIVFAQISSEIYKKIGGWSNKIALFHEMQYLLSIELIDDNVRMVQTSDLPLEGGLHFEISGVPELATRLTDSLYQLLLLQLDNGIEM